MTSNLRDVLVVEDDKDINQLVCAFLGQAGYEYRSAADGAGALREADQRAPGLILLDVMLPDVDGFEVCRRLKGSDRTSSVPVIMVTALGDEKNCQKGLAAGAAEYMPKPFDPENLLATIARYIPTGK